MVFLRLCIVLLAVLLGVGQTANAAGGEETIASRVEVILAAYAAGEFRTPSGLAPGGGWDLTLPSGRTVTRSFLRYQAKPLIELGSPAVEPLIASLPRQGDPATRYIVVYALDEISNRRSGLDYRRPPTTAEIDQAAKVWRAGVADAQEPRSSSSRK